MQTVLVTGGSGFIGRNLVQELARRSCRIRCLVRPASHVRHLRKAGAELVVGDVNQPDSLRAAVSGVDTVFHIAGLTTAFGAEQLMRVNGAGTWNVAQACAAQPTPPVLITVSSLAAAGPVAVGEVRRESDPPVPVSDYGRSKRSGELAAEAWSDRVPATVVRPGIVFGPWDRLTLPMFRSIVRLRVHPVPTFAPPPLSLLHVDDLVDVLLRAAERGTRLSTSSGGGSLSGAGYYHACSGQHVTYAALGRMISRAAGRRHVFLFHLAEPLPWLVAGVTEMVARLAGQTAIVNVDKMRESIQPSWAASPQAIREQLGFSEPCSLEERLRQTVDWYRDHRWL